MAELGFVGLGTMGSRVAKRLLDAGHHLTGHNRTRARAEWLIDIGMKWADTPREVAERADITLSMVTGTLAVRAIAEGPDGIISGLGPGKVWVEMSTVGSDTSRELAAAVSQRGAEMLDAPVSGSVVTLEEGRLSIMVGGSEEALASVRGVLEDIGPKVTYVGGNGQAVLMKIATNLNLAVQMLAFSEAVLLAEKGGIAREKAVEVLLKSVIASPMVKYRGPFVLEQPADAWFNVNMMQKDLLLAMEAGRSFDVPLPTTATTNEFLTAARAMGFEERDFAVIFQVLEHLSGMAR